MDEIAQVWSKAETFQDERKFKKKWSSRIKTYRAYLKSLELAESTQVSYITPIASFFKWLEAPIKISLPTVLPTFHNRDITTEEVRRIISHVPHSRDRAFFAVMAQSGLRPVTLAKLQFKDLKDDWINDRIPVMIHIPRKKSKGEYKEYFTFMGSESVKYLREYWDLRLGVGINPKDNDLIFSQSDSGNAVVNVSSISNIFSRAAIKLGITQRRNGKPKQIRMYNLRKWFRNNASRSPKVDSTFTHFWMGHKLEMKDDHYFTKDPERHRELYSYAMPSLNISEITLTKTQNVPLDKVIKLERENIKLKETLDAMNIRLNNLTARKAEIDEPLNLLLKDPEVEALLLRKIKELLREGKLTR